MTRTDRVEVEINAKIDKALGDVKALAAGFVSVSAAIALGKEALNAWMEQEKASAKLASAIKATGQEATISQRALEALSSELQGVTTYGDEATTSAMAMLQQLGNLSEQGLKTVIPLTQDFAAAMGMDLEQAATAIGKTIGSTTNALGRYGIQVDGTASKDEKLAEITRQLNEKFGGMAKTMAETTEGGLMKFKNAIGDLLEVGGELLSRVILPIVKPLTEWAQALGALIANQNEYRRALEGDKTADLGMAVKFAEGEYIKLNRAYLAMRDTMVSTDPYSKALLEQKRQERDAAGRVMESLQAELALRSAEQRATEKRTATTRESYLSEFELIQMQEDALRGLSVLKIDAARETKAFTIDINAQAHAFDQDARALEGLINKSELSIAYMTKAEKETQAWADTLAGPLQTAFSSTFEQLGKSIATASLSWDDWKNTAKNAIAAVLEAIGRHLLIEAFKSLIPAPGLFNPAAAAPAFGLSAAAFVAAGAVRAMATGGEFTTRGPQLLMVGDNPGGHERVSVTPTAGSGSGGEQVIHNVFSIDGNVLAEWYTRASRDKRALTYAGSII